MTGVEIILVIVEVGFKTFPRARTATTARGVLILVLVEVGFKGDE